MTDLTTDQANSTTPTPPPPAGSRRSRGVLLLRVIGPLLAVCVLLVGVFAVISTFFVQHSTQTRSFSSGVHQIRVSAENGDVAVRTGAVGSPTVVTARTTTAFRTGRHTESLAGDVLTITGTCTGRFPIADNCGVSFSITVPPGSAVQASTDNGDIRVSGISGRLQLSTDNGDVHALRLTSGTTSAHSANGDLHLGFAKAPGNVSATSSNGDITITVPTVSGGYRVQSDTDNGDRKITVPVATTSGRVIYAKTSNGDIEIQPVP